MALECASTVEICAVRATRLDSLGNPAQPPNNVYVVQDVLQLQETPQTIGGADHDMLGGCGGCVIATKTDDEQIRRFDLQLDAGRLEPGLLEMLTGATVLDDSGTVVGVSMGARRPCGTPQARVAFEAWSKRWTTDDEQDPVVPWWHWIWPSVAWMIAQNTLQADFGPVVVTGKSRANTAWGVGPYGDTFFDSATGDQVGIWADAGDLPVGTCDYSSIHVAT